APASIARSAASAAAAAGFELAATAAIYRTDGVVRRAQALQEHPLNLSPRITLNPDDAQAAGLSHGQVAKVGAPDGTATLPVFVDKRVAKGAAWIESGHGATAPLGAGRVTVVGA
ncbi:MAG: molybdopterin dinucleotide binding domain-containing protein, partial [Pseudoxanthomonas sp.]